MYPKQARKQQPPPGTVTARNSVEICTYQPLYSPRPAKRDRRGRDKLLHKCMTWSLKFHDLPEPVPLCENLYAGYGRMIHKHG